jgi:hypothetical protein
MSKGRTAFAEMAVPNSANFPHLSLFFLYVGTTSRVRPSYWIQLLEVLPC